MNFYESQLSSLNTGDGLIANFSQTQGKITKENAFQQRRYAQEICLQYFKWITVL